MTVTYFIAAMILTVFGGAAAIVAANRFESLRSHKKVLVAGLLLVAIIGYFARVFLWRFAWTPIPIFVSLIIVTIYLVLFVTNEVRRKREIARLKLELSKMKKDVVAKDAAIKNITDSQRSGFRIPRYNPRSW